jgi:plasmid maintenance system killer protein
MALNRVFTLVIGILALACGPRSEVRDGGFDPASSDPAAVELADSIMSAMGGRDSWEKTRFISWSFSGRRNLVWDKQDGRVRIEVPEESMTYLLNLGNGQGKVKLRQHEVTHADSLKRMLQQARSIWINDSYWLIMPFKIKDSGVTLRYLGEDKLMNGGKCNVLDLTITQTGKEPESRYRVYVDLADNLVKQWSYFRKADQDSATFTRPWDNYKKYGDILLSADRSDGSGPRDVKVDEDLPDTVFTEF